MFGLIPLSILERPGMVRFQAGSRFQKSLGADFDTVLVFGLDSTQF